VFIAVNNDDDDGNWTNDCQDNVTGPITNEDDLVEFRVALAPVSLDSGTVVLEVVEGMDSIRVWDNPHKGDASNCLIGASSSTNSIQWTVGPSGDIANLGAFPYGSVWIEGITNTLTNTRAVVELRYQDMSGVVHGSDSIVFRVLEIAFVHAEGDDIGLPMTHLPLHTPYPGGGVGMGPPTGSPPVVDLVLEFTGAVATATVDMIDVTYMGTTYTATETAVNSLVFQDGASGLTVELFNTFTNCTSQTETIELLTALPSLGITNSFYNCLETTESSMVFQNDPCAMTIELSDLSSATADINTVQIAGLYGSYSNALIESAVDSCTFAESNITVKLVDCPSLSTTSEDMLVLAVDYSANGMSNTALRVWETGTNTLVFTNSTPDTATDIDVDDLAVSSNLTWQVKINGMSDPTLIASCEVATDDDTTNATMTSVASLLSTEKFVLTQLGVTASEVGGAYTLLRLNDVGAIWTKTYQHVGVNLAFIGGCQLRQRRKAQGSAVVLQSLDAVGLQSLLLTRPRITSKLQKMNYQVLADYKKVKKATALSDKYIQGKSIWYSMSHGNLPDGVYEPWKGLEFVDGVIKKSDIPAGLDYTLVIANACGSAQTDLTSEADAIDIDTVMSHCAQFADKFGDNVAYVGWAWELQPGTATEYMGNFLKALKYDSALGRGRTVQEARDKVVADAGAEWGKILKTYGKTGNIIDRKKD
ncbi:MAG: hypothetical protein HN919_12535, partial [Verrucomicrobia bacterium]|nr:hypothetical protein [Verrucomicrobiota bacterium]